MEKKKFIEFVKKFNKKDNMKKGGREKIYKF